MNLEGIALTRLCRELNEALTGGRIERIFQTDKHKLIIHVRGYGMSYKLLISLHPEKPGCFFAIDTPENPDQPPSFCMLLRKHLEEGKIAGIEQVGFDRILCINIDVRGDRNLIITKQLYLELMGKNSNVIFVHDGTIVDAAKKIGSNNNRFRQILPGINYVLPPQQDKRALCDYATLHLPSDSSSLGKALVSFIGGIGPQTAAEICARSGLPQSLQLQALEASDKCELNNALSSLAEAVYTSAEECTVIYRDNSLISIAPYSCGEQKSDSTNFPMFCDAVAFAWSLQEQHSFDEKDKLVSFVQNEITRARHRHDALIRDQADCQLSETYKIMGDVLLCYGHMIDGRPSSTTLPDIYNEPATIEIQLDSRYDAAGNARIYYNKYNKLQRARDHITVQLAEVETLINYLDSISGSLITTENRADILQIEQELHESGIRLLAKTNRKQLKREESRPLEYTSPSGYPLFVGKNNKQNDIVTFKLAAPNDLWFHTKDIPGSHVVLKCSNATPPETDIEYAANLAAYYSKARESSKVPVDYTVRRQVKKPSGAKPGFVIYFEQKTIMAQPLKPA